MGVHHFKIYQNMKYFILFLFPLFATTLNTQTEFAPIGAEWAYNSIIDRESVYWDSTKILGLIDVFKSTGDTVIDGLTLRKVNNYLFHQSGDSVSVWHAGNLYLIYNFGLQEGDVETFYHAYVVGFYPQISNAYFEAITFTVDSVRTSVVSGQSLKSIYGTLGTSGSKHQYIEKIGAFNNGWGMIGNWESITGSEYEPWLRCYKDATIDYKSEKFLSYNVPDNDCYYTPTSAVAEPADLRISFQPNPVQDALHIQSAELSITSCMLVNAVGKIAYINQKLNTNTLQIPMGELPNGLYVCQLVCGNQRVVSRVIKI
jgi:hypothetical protein